jgi:heme exporter protein CcmB
VAVRGLVAGYDARTVLRSVDLDLAPGTVTALLGPNAAGKSTLLAVLAGLHPPRAGHIVLAGIDARRRPRAARRAVGLVAHGSLLVPDLSVRENLALYGRLYAVPERDARAEALGRRLGVWDRADERVRSLSRGLQQRTAIARALLHAPEVLLLDEPYTALDPAGAATLDALLAELAAAGRTVLLASHDLERARSVADHVMVLRSGRVVWCGDAAALDAAALARLYERPAPDRRAPGPGDPIDAAGDRSPPAAPEPADTAPPGRSPGPADAGPGVLAAAAAVTWKDLRVELRAREVVPPVLVFGLVVLVVMHFSLAVEPALEALVAPGALWVGLAFASTLGLARLMGGDVDAGVLPGLAASPADRGGLFAGKWLAGYAFSLLSAAVLVPAFAVLLNLPFGNLPAVALVVAVGLAGWQAAGTLFGALAAVARAREVLLPVLLLPAAVPLLVAAVSATGSALAGTAVTAALPAWLLLAAYGAIFWVAGFLLYPIVLESSS